MSNFEHVKKFMKTFGQEVKEKAEFPSNKIISLRYDLIREELDELKDAIDKKDINYPLLVSASFGSIAFFYVFIQSLAKLTYDY